MWSVHSVCLLTTSHVDTLRDTQYDEDESESQDEMQMQREMTSKDADFQTSIP